MVHSSWHQWFHKETLPSMEPFHSTKDSLQWEKVSLDYWNVLHTKKKIVLLRTAHWNILWGTKTGCSMASLWKPPFGTFYFLLQFKINVSILKHNLFRRCSMSLVSHDPSEIILICWFGAQETFLLLSMLKKVVLLNVHLFEIEI